MGENHDVEFEQVESYYLKNILLQYDWLVVESAHLKNISQNGNLPQIGVEINKYLKPPPIDEYIYQNYLRGPN